MKKLLILLSLALLMGCADESKTVKDACTDNDVEVKAYYYEKLPDGAQNIKLIDNAEKYNGDVWFTFDLEGNHFLIGMYGGGDRFGMCITQIK